LTGFGVIRFIGDSGLLFGVTLYHSTDDSLQAYARLRRYIAATQHTSNMAAITIVH